MRSLDAIKGLKRVKFLGLLLLYFALAAVCIGANPFRGEITGPFDILAASEGWNSSAESVNVRHPERTDIVDALLPAWLDARRQLREGHLPLWNPLRAGGVAGLVDPVHAELTPAFLIFAIAPDPAFGFYFSVLFNLAVAGLGMHLLAGARYSMGAALFSGISYMMCGFIAAWLFWQHTHTAIWIPWLLFAVDRYIAEGKRAALAGISVSSLFLILGGFPFVTALGFGAALLHIAVSGLSVKGSNASRATYAFIAILLGIGLAAIPILSLVSLLGSSDLGYRHGGTPLRLNHLSLLSLPWASQSSRVAMQMYVGMLALVFAIVGTYRLLRNKLDGLALSGALFAVVGFVIAFGLIPKDVASHLPVLSNNPWNRAILLLDLGIILVAAYGVDWIGKAGLKRTVVIPLLVLIVVIQMADIGYQFRRFNGPTPARYFFPENALIDQLAKTAGPFEYIGQDGGFYKHSGTLAAYGLGDWYGHSIRSSQLRVLLDKMADKPFTSPTSTGIGIEQFDWNSNLMDVVGMCFAIFPHQKQSLVLAKSAGRGARMAMRPASNVRVSQHLDFDKVVSIRAIEVRVATYRETGLDGAINLEVVDADDGSIMANSSLPGSALFDNQMIRFEFSKPVSLKKGGYELAIQYVPGRKNLRMTYWVVRNGRDFILRAGEKVAGSLDFRIFSDSNLGLDIISSDGHASIAENPGCMHGPYWTRDIDRPLQGALMNNVKIKDYIAHEFKLEVDAPALGYLVVPMQYAEGWKAYRNGKQVSLRLIEGVLPAVQLPAGDSIVLFRYRPPNFVLGFAVSVASLFLLILLLLKAAAGKKSESSNEVTSNA